MQAALTDNCHDHLSAVTGFSDQRYLSPPVALSGHLPFTNTGGKGRKKGEEGGGEKSNRSEEWEKVERRCAGGGEVWRERGTERGGGGISKGAKRSEMRAGLAQREGVRLVSGRTSVRYRRFGSTFCSKRLWFVDTVLWLCPTFPTETLKWLSSLPILTQESFWWWQCSDRYIITSPSPYPLFSPSLISLMVCVDIKHHVYLLRNEREKRE